MDEELFSLLTAIAQCRLTDFVRAREILAEANKASESVSEMKRSFDAMLYRAERAIITGTSQYQDDQTAELAATANLTKSLWL